MSRRAAAAGEPERLASGPAREPRYDDAAVVRVDLWRVYLDGAAGPEVSGAGDLVVAPPDVLSPDECERAARFRFEHHRRRFIAARAALRVLIARTIGAHPSELRFGTGAYGKPFLHAGPLNEAGRLLRFNLSHSDAYAVVAMTSGSEVGVDIERVQPVADWEHLTETVFSQAERAQLAALPPEERLEGFFSGWTRKESYLKALGEGLHRPLADFDVTLAPQPPRLLAVRALPGELTRWSFSPIAAVDGYAGAVCVESPQHEIVCHWQDVCPGDIA